MSVYYWLRCHCLYLHLAWRSSTTARLSVFWLMHAVNQSFWIVQLIWFTGNHWQLEIGNSQTATMWTWCLMRVSWSKESKESKEFLLALMWKQWGLDLGWGGRFGAGLRTRFTAYIYTTTIANRCLEPIRCWRAVFKCLGLNTGQVSSSWGQLQVRSLLQQSASQESLWILIGKMRRRRRRETSLFFLSV